MIVGDLFSGIGGFSLAAEWMGWRTAFFSEIDPYASRVLAHHWPDVPNLGDITKVDWATAPAVDILTGGFPCQPHSLAGTRKGSADERDLFDEIIRAASVLRPRYLVLENVAGLLTSDDGRFFGRVLGAVAALGYDAEWRVLSASDVGAPHRRERVWVVAHPPQLQRNGRDDHSRKLLASKPLPESRDRRGTSHVAHAISQRGRGGHGPRQHATDAHAPGEAVRAGGDGGWWATEPDVGRVAHGVPARVDRLRGLGNSIVPQCALEIFRGIEAREVAEAA